MKTGRSPSPLRRREFRLYFAGNVTSNIGNWINAVVLAVYMHALTDSSFWVGLVGFGLFVPVIVFALPAGALADRVDRVRLLQRAQILMCLLAVALTVLVATGHGNRWVVTAISFGMGIGTAIAIPTMQALVPSLVPREELSDAIQMNALTFNTARVLGPVLAAVVYATLGATWAFAINALTFVPLVVALGIIGTPPFQRRAEAPPGPIREGISYAWRHLRTRWLLLAIVAIGIALDPVTTLSPALAQRLGLPEGGAAWIVASWGAGAVLAILFGRSVIRAMTEHGMGWAGLVVLAGGMVGLGAASTVPLAIAAGVVTGAGYISATMVFTTTIQQDVPESLRGRVSALWTLAFLGPRAFAAVADGALADAIGANRAASLFGLAALVAVPFVRRVSTTEGEPIPPPA